MFAVAAGSHTLRHTLRITIPDRRLVSAPALPALPPRSATEIVDGAVQLIRPQFGYFLRIAAIGAIPALVQAVLTLILFPVQPTEPGALLQRELKMLPLTLLTYAFASMQSGAIITGALALLRGEVLPTVWQAFTAAFRRMFALLGVSLLTVLLFMAIALPIVIAGAFLVISQGASLGPSLGSGSGAAILIVVAAVALLAVIIAVFLTVFARSAVMTCLVIAEGLGPIESLRRAHALSRGHYLLLAKTYGLVLLIVGVVYGVMASIATAFRDQQQVVQALLSVLIVPVVPILGGIMLLTYADLRVRREGADLDAALEALPGLTTSPG
ncbi:MAG TPA: hypothetical protein VE861_10900 [Gemmatimonadaceae bacterium]|nr:hypothetical protein [Gemmatimonadaceae bacterium]